MNKNFKGFLVLVSSLAVLCGSARAQVVREGFAPGVSFGTEGAPLNVSLADIDGDGLLDVGTANFMGGVSILRNISTVGNPQLAASVFFPAAPGTFDVQFGDLDGDGKQDMVVVVAGGVSVFRNTSTPGAISFAPRADFVFGALSLPNGVAIRDYNGDGKLDLAFLNNDDSAVRVLKNVSSPGALTTNSFVVASQYITIRPFVIASGDFNGDGRPDILTGSQSLSRFYLNTSSNEVTAFSSAFSTPPVRTFQDAHSDNILAGEFDGNTLTDLLVRLSNTVFVYRNVSTNVPLSFRTNSIPGAWTGTGIGDLNGDNKLDVVTASRFGQQIAVHTNHLLGATTSSNAFVVQSVITTSNNPFALIIGDIDGDNRNDIVSSSSDNANVVTIYRNLLNHAPVADAGADQVLECVNGGATVTLSGSGSSDADGDLLAYTWFNGTSVIGTGAVITVELPTGSHAIQLVATDSEGASVQDGVNVSIRDTTAPELLTLTANPAVLWPPDGRMVSVTVSAEVADGCDTAGAQARIIGVRTRNGGRKGAIDWQITGLLTVDLRAERSGKDFEKVYWIDVEAYDAAGNRSTNVVTVTVPHDIRLDE